MRNVHHWITCHRTGIRLTSLILLTAALGIGCAESQQPRPASAEVPTAPAGAAPAPSPAAQPAAPALPAEPDLGTATREKPLRPAQPAGRVVRNHPSPPNSTLPRLDALKLPAGFSIELYTDQVPHGRSLALGTRGTVFVGTRRDNRVYAVVDKDRDNKVDKVYTIASGLDTPNGIAFHKGSLYVAEIGRILRYDRIEQRLANPPKPVVVTDQLPKDRQTHCWRYIRFGPDGLLYAPIGAPCNICKRDEPIYASMARMKPDGSALEVFSSGVRNSVGFDWHPETKELWFTENGRDELGNEIPPDELNRAATSGLHFGFPHCHAGVILDPEFGDRPCTEFEPPVQLLGPHTAALGMRFYTGSMFPPEYKNAVIIAEHGSWNRGQKYGYRVMVVRLDGNKAVSYEPLIAGWLDENRDEAWGRPVDVEILEDGSLLISDDWKGAIYRVSYRR